MLLIVDLIVLDYLIFVGFLKYINNIKITLKLTYFFNTWTNKKKLNIGNSLIR